MWEQSQSQNQGSAEGLPEFTAAAFHEMNVDGQPGVSFTEMVDFFKKSIGFDATNPDMVAKF